MEYENHYADNNFAKKGTAGTALGIAIGAGALSLMNNGGLGNIFGTNGKCGCSEDHTVNRYELGMQQALAAKDSRISLLESNIYVDSKIADVYERLNAKIGVLEATNAQQAVFNATNTAVINCLQNQVNTLMSLTKVVVPLANICPQPSTTA